MLSKPFAYVDLQEILRETGDNFKRARLRRHHSLSALSRMAGVGRTTLWSIENGSMKVSIGAYARVLRAMQLEKDFLKLGADDEQGRRRLEEQLKRFQKILRPKIKGYYE